MPNTDDSTVETVSSRDDWVRLPQDFNQAIRAVEAQVRKLPDELQNKFITFRDSTELKEKMSVVKSAFFTVEPFLHYVDDSKSRLLQARSYRKAKWCDHDFGERNYAYCVHCDRPNARKYSQVRAGNRCNVCQGSVCEHGICDSKCAFCKFYAVTDKRGPDLTSSDVDRIAVIIRNAAVSEAQRLNIAIMFCDWISTSGSYNTKRFFTSCIGRSVKDLPNAVEHNKIMSGSEKRLNYTVTKYDPGTL